MLHAALWCRSCQEGSFTSSSFTEQIALVASWAATLLSPVCLLDLVQSCRFLKELYGHRTAADAPPAAGGSSSSSTVELLEAWNSRITSARRTKTVRQKWQELLLSVNGEQSRAGLGQGPW